MRKSISSFNNNTIHHNLRSLFFFLERTSNVAAVLTERGDNDKVNDSLKYLETTLKKIIQYRDIDEYKFNAFLWSKSIFDEYIKADDKGYTYENSNIHSVEPPGISRTEFSIPPFYTEKDVNGLYRFLEAFKKIWRSGVKFKNKEISRNAIFGIVSLLFELSGSPKNELIIRQLLNFLNSVCFELNEIFQENGSFERSSHSASYGWYFTVLYSRSIKRSGYFDFGYLPTFNAYLIKSVTYTLEFSNTRLFNALVSSMHDSPLIDVYAINNIESMKGMILTEEPTEYASIDSDIKLEINSQILRKAIQSIDSIDKYESCVDSFNSLVIEIVKKVNKNTVVKLEPYFDKVRESIYSQLLYSNLRDIAFSVGVTALFHKKYSYIRFLWEYKQPEDSDATWGGIDLLPLNFMQLSDSYFKKGDYQRDIEFYKDHHGSRKYTKEYFIYQLLYMLRNIDLDDPRLRDYELPEYDNHRLSDIADSIEIYKAILSSVTKKRSILNKLGINKQHIDNLVVKKAFILLDTIKEDAVKKIDSRRVEWQISNAKVIEFKELAHKSFLAKTKLRTYFDTNSLIVNKDYSEKQRFGIRRFVDKAAFFDDWHVYYSDMGNQYGSELGIAENSFLFENIAKKCAFNKQTTIDASLIKNIDKKNILILTTNSSIYQFLNDYSEFTPKLSDRIKERDPATHYDGSVIIGGTHIPILNVPVRLAVDQLLVIDKSKLGNIMQYQPISPSDAEHNVLDMLYIDIKEYDDNKDVIAAMLEKPPIWLDEYGDKDSQICHLKTLVMIEIYEIFEYASSVSEIGYMIHSSI